MASQISLDPSKGFDPVVLTRQVATWQNRMFSKKLEDRTSVKKEIELFIQILQQVSKNAVAAQIKACCTDLLQIAPSKIHETNVEQPLMELAAQEIADTKKYLKMYTVFEKIKKLAERDAELAKRFKQEDTQDLTGVTIEELDKMEGAIDEVLLHQPTKLSQQDIAKIIDFLKIAIIKVKTGSEFSEKFKAEFSSFENCKGRFTGKEGLRFISILTFYGAFGSNNMPQILSPGILAENMVTLFKIFPELSSKPETLAKIVEGKEKVWIQNIDVVDFFNKMYAHTVLTEECLPLLLPEIQKVCNVQKMILPVVTSGPYANTVSCINTFIQMRTTNGEEMQKLFSSFENCKLHFQGNEAVGFVSRIAFYGWIYFLGNTTHLPEIFSKSIVEDFAKELGWFVSHSEVKANFAKIILGTDKLMVNTPDGKTIDAVDFFKTFVNRHSNLTIDDIAEMLPDIKKCFSAPAQQNKMSNGTESTDKKDPI